MPKPAVFLDRDNTLIDDPGFLSSPDQVQLRPGAASALRELNQAGYPVVVVTNQSGVARGYFDERALEAIHQRVRELFQSEGARIDAVYFCPFLPGDEAKVAEYRKDSHLRKPKPGMLLQAAGELDLDPIHTANFDMIRHYRPGQNVIGRPVRPGHGHEIIGHHEILLPLLRQALIETMP